MKTEKIKTSPGDNFTEVTKRALMIASMRPVIVEFNFNEVVCLVGAKTNPDLLYRDYSRSWTMGWKTVGPDCPENYSPEVQAEWEAKSKAKEEERAAQEAACRATDAKEKADLENLVRGVELDLKDPAGWKKSRQVNSDGYGGAALDYAEAWAKKMQIEIAKGATVAQCYESTQDGLGFLGITGFQFGCAVSTLSQVWKHGDELREWHNQKYGVKSNTGTANPAILTIET